LSHDKLVKSIELHTSTGMNKMTNKKKM